MAQFLARPFTIGLCAALAGCGDPSGGPVAMPAAAPASAAKQISSPGAPLETAGAVSPVHDPAIIKQGDTYFLFSTGHVRSAAGLLPVRTSTDLETWTLRGAAVPDLPEWVAAAVPGAKGMWAPDVSVTHGETRLYYSVSTFGSNRSAIGLTVNGALDPANPGAGWTDKGPVIQSRPGDDLNAIDPNVFDDADGNQWMAFGSFWSGIRMVRLDRATGLRDAADDTIHALASRPHPGAIEAPFVIRHGGLYYLFVSFDLCCRGTQSTYNTVVGRAARPTGPFVDAAGKAMLDGGGTPVLGSNGGTGKRFVGRGHVAILQDGGREYIVYHGYDTQRRGASTLRIRSLTWNEQGWPMAE